MFERAISKHYISVKESFMIGDKETDLIPARKLGISTIILGNNTLTEYADYRVSEILEVLQILGF